MEEKVKEEKKSTDRNADSPEAGKAKNEDKGGEGRTTPPPADFSTFILSLSTSVLMHLGDIKNPDSDKVEKNLPLARHTIDIIEMLREKTGGNLTKEEAYLIEEALYDLRTRYCRET